MTRRKRAGVMLATGLIAISATGLAMAEPATSPPEVAPAAEHGPLDARHASLLDGPERAADRARRRRGVFPVGGPVGYGEGGAQFGADRGGRMHEGQDVFAPAGTPLVAVRDGVVVETGDDGGRGNYVAIFSPQARQTYVYLHMQSPSRVKPGERVSAGRRVGELGCTGSCFGDHLHFEVRRGRGPEGPPVDPRPLLRRWR